MRLRWLILKQNCNFFPDFLVDNENLEIRLLCHQRNLFWKLNTNRNSISLTGSGIRHRIARQTSQTLTQYSQCNRNAMTYVEGCMNSKWDLSCKMQSHSCYYMVTCRNQQPRNTVWSCTEVHLTTDYPVCCDLICPSKWIKFKNEI